MLQVIGACAASRFGGKAVLLFAVFLWSVSTSVTPLLATSVPALIFCRVLLGLGEGLGRLTALFVKYTMIFSKLKVVILNLVKMYMYPWYV
jgi:MFS family permease